MAHDGGLGIARPRNDGGLPGMTAKLPSLRVVLTPLGPDPQHPTPLLVILWFRTMLLVRIEATVTQVLVYDDNDIGCTQEEI